MIILFFIHYFWGFFHKNNDTNLHLFIFLLLTIVQNFHYYLDNLILHHPLTINLIKIIVIFYLIKCDLIILAIVTPYFDTVDYCDYYNFHFQILTQNCFLIVTFGRIITVFDPYLHLLNLLHLYLLIHEYHCVLASLKSLFD